MTPFGEFPTLLELSALIEKRELSPVELTEYYLDRIATYGGALNAYICASLPNVPWVARAPRRPRWPPVSISGRCTAYPSPSRT